MLYVRLQWSFPKYWEWDVFVSVAHRTKTWNLQICSSILIVQGVLMGLNLPFVVIVFTWCSAFSWKYQDHVVCFLTQVPKRDIHKDVLPPCFSKVGEIDRGSCCIFLGYMESHILHYVCICFSAFSTWILCPTELRALRSLAIHPQYFKCSEYTGYSEYAEYISFTPSISSTPSTPSIPEFPENSEYSENSNRFTSAWFRVCHFFPPWKRNVNIQNVHTHKCTWVGWIMLLYCRIVAL